MFGFSSIMFNDYFIEKRMNSLDKDSIGYVMTKETLRVLLTMIFGALFFNLIKYFSTKTPQEQTLNLSLAIIRGDRSILMIAIKSFNEACRLRNFLFCVVVFVLSLILLMHSVIFCSIYVKSRPGWIWGGILSIALDLTLNTLIVSLIGGFIAKVINK